MKPTLQTPTAAPLQQQSPGKGKNLPVQRNRWVAAITALQGNVASHSLAQGRWAQFRAGCPLWHLIAPGESGALNFTARGSYASFRRA